MKTIGLRIPSWVWVVGVAAFGFLTWSFVLVILISWNRATLNHHVARMVALERCHQSSHRLLRPRELAGDRFPTKAKWKDRVNELEEVFLHTVGLNQPRLRDLSNRLALKLDQLYALSSRLGDTGNAEEEFDANLQGLIETITRVTPAFRAKQEAFLLAIERIQAEIQSEHENTRQERDNLTERIGTESFRLNVIVLLTVTTMVLTALLAWRDAKRRKTAEERLRASEEKYTNVYLHGPIAYVHWGLNGQLIDCNIRAERLFGWPREEVAGRSLMEFIPEHAQAETAQSVASLIEEQTSITRIAPVLSRDGRELLCEWRSALLHNAQGQAESVISSAVDVTERIRSEAQIRESEARYRKLFESNLVGITLMSAKGSIDGANDAFLSMVGYTREELQQHELDWIRLTPPEYLPLDDAAIKEIYETGSCTPYEKTYIHKNGRHIPVLIGSTDFDPTGNRGQTHLCFVLDLTLRREAEARARATSDLIESIHRAQLDFIADTDLDHVFESLLESLLRLTNSKYGFIGEVLYAPDGAPYTVARAITDISWDETSRAFYEANIKTGLEFHNLKTLVGAVVTTRRPVMSGSPNTDPRSGGLPPGHPPLNAFLGLPFSRGDRLLGVIGIANCPTGYSEAEVAFLEPLLTTCASLVEAQRAEQRRTEAESVLQATKEAAVAANRAKDRFLAVLSHELRTPLTPVLAAVSLALDDPATSPETRALCAMIARNVELEARLIDDLLDVSRINRGMFRLDPVVVDAHEIIQEVLNICHEDIILTSPTKTLGRSFSAQVLY